MTGVEVGAIAAYASAAAAVVGAVSTFVGAQETARQNDENARLAQQRGALDAARRRRQARLNLGQTRAAIGASGITLEGTALDILEDNARQEELDALIIEHNASLESLSARNQASAARTRGAVALVTGGLQAGSAILNAPSSPSTSKLRGQTGGASGPTRPGASGDGTRG